MSASGRSGSSKNIPSLVLTNNDIISPIVCLFDTTGQLLGGLGQEEGKEERQSKGQGTKEKENRKGHRQQGRKNVDKKERNKNKEEAKKNTNEAEICRGDKIKEYCSYRSRTPQPEDEVYEYNESMILAIEQKPRRRSECSPYPNKQEVEMCKKGNTKKVNNVTFFDAQSVKQQNNSSSDDCFLHIKEKDSKDSRLLRRKSETPVYIHKTKETSKHIDVDAERHENESKRSATSGRSDRTSVTSNTRNLSSQIRMSRRKSATPFYNITPENTSSVPDQDLQKTQLFVDKKLPRRVSSSSLVLPEAWSGSLSQESRGELEIA